MVNTLRRFLALTVLFCAVAALATGCGRKSDLDPPSLAAADKNNRNAKPVVAPKPDKPFFLDPLL